MYITTAKHTSVLQAISLMSEARNKGLPTDPRQFEVQTSCILVVEGTQLVGIFTAEDVVRLVAEGADLNFLQMADVMRRSPLTATASQCQDICAIFNLLQQHQIRYLPVLDDQKQQVVGLLTYEAICQQMATKIESLQTHNLELEQTVKLQMAEYQRSEAQNHAILMAIPDLMFHFNSEGIYLGYFSTNYVMDVISPDVNPVGKHLSDVLPPELAQRKMNYLRQALTTGEIQIFEQQILIGDKLQYEEVRIVKIDDYEALSMIRDISDRKQALLALEQLNQELEVRIEQRTVALQQSEARNRAILSALPDLLLLLKRDGTCLDCMLPSTLGSADFIPIKHHISEVLSPEIVAQQLQNADRAIATGVIQLYEHQLEKFGKLVHEEVRVIPYREDEVLVLVRDISDRKYAQAQLITANQLQQAILDGVNYIIISTNSAGIIQTFNATAQRLLGYTPDEVVGKATLTIFQDPQEIQQRAQILSAQLGRKISPNFNELSPPDLLQFFDQSEWTFIHKDDLNFPVSLSITALQDELGNFTGFVAIASNITERKQVEENMRMSLEREKELSQLRSRFIAMVSHEFRTPLAIISSSTGILQDYSDRLTEEKKQQHLKRIQSNIIHISELLDDVLTINRAEADKLEFKPRKMDLVKFCQNLVEELQLSSSQHEIVFFFFQTELHQILFAHIDPKLLRQILTNLLTNAIKYSPQGSMIKLNLAAQGIYAVLKVQDYGIGIPLEDQAQLFESFHRAQNVGSIPGTGLGLSIVKKCVDLHKGEIAVSSQIGMGTTITVSIPCLGKEF